MEQEMAWHWGLAQGALGRLIRSARRLRGIRQSELARQLSLSSSNLSRIEHGRDLRVSTLLEIARALKLEPVLVPKEHVAAVRALLSHEAAGEGEALPEQSRFE
jgi:transcriptional regulator with XRE-family HTH domain